MQKHFLFGLITILLMASCESRPDADVETGEAKVDSMQQNPPNTVVDEIEPSAEYLDLSPELREELLGYGIDAKRGVPVGLKVGDSAPVFKQRTLSSEEVFLPDLYKNGPVVLFFYRGQWCPICTRYMSGFQDSLNLITNAGATVLAVGPETTENAKKTVDETNADFHVIADANGFIMNAFRVGFYVTDDYEQKIIDKYNDGRSIAQNNGTPEARLPVPATFIIDKKGKIRWRHFDLDYKNRASVKSIVQALEELPK